MSLPRGARDHPRFHLVFLLDFRSDGRRRRFGAFSMHCSLIRSPTPHGRTIRKRENVLDSSARYLQYTTVRTPVFIGTTRRLHARVKTIK